MKVYDNPNNLGIVESIMHGMKRATAPYLCSLDHDDVFSPSAVLEYLDGIPDLVYTNEYKFSEKKHKPLSVYKKPKYDLLSILFYFYTHHITAVRTSIMQEIVERYTEIDNKYTAIYDLDLFMSYIEKFVGKPFQIVHVDHEDYGWRVSSSSTSNDLNQKPACFIERLQRVEEFFLEYGETPIVKLHDNLGFVVEARFFSCSSELHYPLGLQQFTKWVKDGLNTDDSKYNIKTYIDEFNDLEIANLFDMLNRIPLYYFQRNHIENLFIPSLGYNELISKIDYDLHVTNVPFLVMKNLDDIDKLNLKGILISKKDDISKSLGIVVMKKELV